MLHILIVLVGRNTLLSKLYRVKPPNKGMGLLAFVERLALPRIFFQFLSPNHNLNILLVYCDYDDNNSMWFMIINFIIDLLSVEWSNHLWRTPWPPTIDESLLVKPEATSLKDKKAVAVLQDNLIVPCFLFLPRDVNCMALKYDYWEGETISRLTDCFWASVAYEA